MSGVRKVLIKNVLAPNGALQDVVLTAEQGPFDDLRAAMAASPLLKNYVDLRVGGFSDAMKRTRSSVSLAHPNLPGFRVGLKTQGEETMQQDQITHAGSATVQGLRPVAIGMTASGMGLDEKGFDPSLRSLILRIKESTTSAYGYLRQAEYAVLPSVAGQSGSDEGEDKPHPSLHVQISHVIDVVDTCYNVLGGIENMVVSNNDPEIKNGMLADSILKGVPVSREPRLIDLLTEMERGVSRLEHRLTNVHENLFADELNENTNAKSLALGRISVRRRLVYLAEQMPKCVELACDICNRIGANE